MIRLEKFYDLIGRNATVTLASKSLDRVYFEGPLKSIPDKFDECRVEDFTVSIDGDFLFKISI